MKSSQSSSHTNARKISHEFSRSTNYSNIDSTTLKKYVEAVKNAPSINETRIAQVKEQIKKGIYLKAGLFEKMAEKIIQKGA